MADRKTDAYDSRCRGLTGAVAYKGDFKTLAQASYVTRASGPFYCRECLSEAIVRKCSDKDDHFAHKARLSPTGGRGSTEFHHKIRDEFCAILKEHFPDGHWRTEVPLKTGAGENDLRADVTGFFGKRGKDVPAVAIEVQCSPYSPSYIRKKTAAYAAANVHVLWVVPLVRAIGETEFRPRRYELYLHTLNLGYVFYYEPGGQGVLTPVHYGPAFRYIEEKTFFNADAQEVTTGGFPLKYKTLKEPKQGQRVPVQELAGRLFNAWSNPNNNKLDVPERKLMVVKERKWWPKNENEAWLENNDRFAQIKRHFPYYNPDDENDEAEGNDDSFYVKLYMPKPLKLLQASAGSGKTFSLTAHYLTLLFAGETKYREILAVTFTNKATEEMKTRILDDLASLAKGEPKTDAVRRVILSAHPQLNDEKLKAQAERIYRRLLHDYGRFSVSTIDGFVQKVIRGFAFELGIDAGYELEMNFDKVKSALAQRLSRQLDENPNLLQWVIDLALERIEDDRGWNYNKELLELAGEIFKERYRPFEKAMESLLKDRDINGIFKAHSKTTREVIKNFETAWSELAAEANRLFEGTDLKGYVGVSRSPLTNIPKIAGGEFARIEKLDKLLDEPGEWAKAGQHNSLYDRLNPVLNRLSASYKSGLPEYGLAMAVDKHLYFLRLMQEMAILLKSYRQETGTLLISDAQELLQGIIGDDDSNPSFIWEKTGNRYKHFLFDEFQDTSASQWNNFRPLLKNMIAGAEGKMTEHLVVGDAKQSIYRWRNGDWNILHRLVREQIGTAYIIEDSLDVNYRSAENIILFNNLLFGQLPAMIQQQLNEAVSAASQPVLDDWWAATGYAEVVTQLYAQVKQDTHAGTPRGGTVRQKTLRADADGTALTAETFQVAAMLVTASEITGLIETKGYQFGDICVLVRTNDQAVAAVEALMAENIPVISGEALKIANNMTVKLLINTLRVMAGLPDNTAIFKAACISLYAKVNNRLFDPEQFSVLAYKSLGDLEQALPPALCRNWQQWLQLPLPELIERLIGAFDLNKPGQSAHLIYLLAFRDLGGNFAAQGEKGLTAFMDWWDEEGNKKALPSNEHPDAVQVMTIHKSKGLAFRAVMLPFCNWQINGKANSVFWVPSAETAYGELQSLPVRYQGALGKSAVAHAYFEELMFNNMDALNMLYVATTRAKEHLSIITKGKSSSEKLTDSGDMVAQAIKLISDFDRYKPDEDTLLFGGNDEVLPSPAHRSRSNEIKLAYYPLSDRLSEILETEQADGWSLLLSRDAALREGAILHELLSRADHAEDIAPHLRAMVLEGLVKESETDHLSAVAAEVLNHEELKTLLGTAGQILSEQSVISATGERYRPDKILVNGQHIVIIDYKFTQEEAIAHERQVNTYKELLLAMGFTRVDTYLFYARSGKLKTV